MQNPIEIHMIWANEDREPDAVWMVDAWDEFSMDGNYDGWEKAVAKARKENENIRIIVTTVSYSEIQKAFVPAKVESK